MKKLLFSIMLSIVFLTPFTIQANTISEPLYQVDVTHQSPGIVSLKAIAFSGEKPANTVKLTHQFKTANIKITSSKPKIILIGQCNSCHSAATGINGVPGGGSIGISKPG